MFISKVKSGKYYYYRIAETVYRDGKKTTVNLENLGSDAKLRKQYPGRDPDDVAKERLEQLNAEAKANRQVLIQEYDCAKPIPLNIQRACQGGYLFLQSFYYHLGVDKVCREIRKRYHFEYDLNDILSKLIYTRVLYPASKLSSFECSKQFLEPPNFELHDVYRALEIIAKENHRIQEAVYRQSQKIAKRNTKILYYDCTNYFFEIEEESGSKKYGYSKEHRPNPIIQMGLFLDGSGLPLAFSLSPGNTNEQTTLIPLEKQIMEDFELSKFVVCTDAGLSSLSNRKFNTRGERAYITTQSLKKLKAHLKEWALDPQGWHLAGSPTVYDLQEVDVEDPHEQDKIYYKSRWICEDGFEQKLLVSFSPKYRKYLRMVRGRQIERAKNKIETPSKLKQKRAHDPNRFIRVVSTTREGELAEIEMYGLDEQAISQEEIYDGFYAVCTNLDGSEQDILHMNRQRWQIEAAFRTLKLEFEARPVYLQREDRILAHFTTCFLSLLLYKLLEQSLQQHCPDADYTMFDVMDTLRGMNFFLLGNQGYSPAYKRTKITDALHRVVNFRTDYEGISNKGMKKILKLSKKNM